MRCTSCNTLLTDYEATRKLAITNEYVDMCNHCFASVSEDLPTIERLDLAHDDDLIDYEEINHCGLDIDKDY
jgi:hypothetical protein